MELKHIGILSAGRIGAIFGFIVSVISMILFGIAQKLQSSLTAEALTAAGMTPINLTWTTAIIGIISATIYAFVWVVVAAWLYNIIAKRVGGIQVELVDKAKKK